MKKIFYLVALVAISFLFVQCEQQSGSSDMSKYDIGSGEENGHAYVDLGLSVKWATCNIGAIHASDYGDYFAWGHTEPDDHYDWDYYKYGGEDGRWMYKYVTNADFTYNHDEREVDNKIVLEPEDDAATVNWGGAWRMPTKTEMEELVEKCKWIKIETKVDYLTVVKGYQVKGPNGKSIFMPFPGYMSYDNLNADGIFGRGYYWSNSLHADYSNMAYILRICPSGIIEVEIGTNTRQDGLSVRPVCP